jgi:hypothetical protein
MHEDDAKPLGFGVMDLLSGSRLMILRNEIRRYQAFKADIRLHLVRRRRNDIEIHTLSSNAVSILYERYSHDFDSIDSID